MKRQIRIFLAGVMVVAPFVVTAYVLWWAGSGLDGLARRGIEEVMPGVEGWWFPGAGVIFLLAGIYFVGLLTHLWAFRWVLGLMERIFSRMPVVKTVYESVRDVLNIFSGDANKMGQVVRYRVPGTEIDLLGIRTSTSSRLPGKVAVYLPMSYMIGGPTVYVAPESVEPIDMSVEEAMKIAATAGASAPSLARPAQQSDALQSEGLCESSAKQAKKHRDENAG